MAPLLRAGLLTALTLALALCQAAFADERILRFESDLTINDDASLTVVETIEIQAEGSRFQRGILRDFPTEYKDRMGNEVIVSFELTAVSRNGERENYQLEKLSNGVRIRVGHADRFLETGPHTYVITYRTTRQLGFFDNYDELYWNVTGNGWDFVIDVAEARVRLPGGAQAVQRAAYTGLQGATGTNFETFERGGIWTFRTTQPLAPREGLTIAIAWPKGLVPEPTGAERARWFLNDNKATGMALAGVLIVFAYYFFAWRRFGRDPEKGTIFPRFEPPKGLSPAATRFIRMMSFDKQAYSAALISMAVKGYLVIDSEGKSYRLTRAPDADLKKLSLGERRIAKKLFVGDTILLDNENHQLLGASVKRLKQSLKTEYEQAYFQRNTMLFVIGMVISVLTIISVTSASNDPLIVPRAFLLAFVSAVFVYLGLHFFAGGDDDPTFRARGGIRAAPGLIVGIIQVIFFITITSVSSAGAVALSLFANPVQCVCFALLGGLNVLFFFLMKRPTVAGRKIMDEIEGFRMYLGTAEEHRLNMLNPPEKTPELFEKYLPFAMALGVENEWNDKFTRILTLASMAPGSSGYQPRWYRGSDWSASDVGSFTRNLGSSFDSAVSSSTTAPGSSSGSGGGGSSGGGGGGGGGGGW